MAETIGDVVIPENDEAEKQQPADSFATIGAVYADGVSLIFDGTETESEKHYKCNTSILFSAGDRVKLAKDSGTYIVEYAVGAPKLEEPAPEVDGILPTGGTAGQYLKKQSSSDYDAIWETLKGLLPSGGSSGQVLKKSGATDYAAQWAAIDGMLPTGGATGQVLKKSGATNYAVQWAAIDGTLPTGGATGQVLKKSSATNYAVQWAAIDGTLPTGGTTGQVLKKSSTTNYAAQWGDAPIPSSIKNQINTSDTYAIQFRTTTTYGTPKFQIRLGTSGTWYTITTG